MRCHGESDVRGEVVAVLRDISERKTHEQAMEIAQREQERADAAKNRFLATMSHELRTPLNAIIGFSEMLGDDSIVLEPARKKEYARLINDSGRHLLSVVNGILDVSRMETGNFEITPEPFAPAPAIVNCCDLLALKARESGVDIKTRIAPHLPELTADRRAFNQILINLIANAIKFTPRDGRITVSMHCEGAKLVLSVEDTGVGIGEDDLRRVGEAFFQVRGTYDRRHDGTGLGLSIVKGLVRLHDGEVDIASRLGNGTRVTVTLPLDASRRSVQPVKLVTDRAKEFPAVADVKTQVKKSA
jgi:two-component system, cell cycle sensor histidine kinase DivJ